MRLFYERYAGYLTAVCSRYVPDRASAQDILQDAFLQIFDAVSYRQEFSNVEYNNEQVQGASRKVQNVDDRIAQIKTYIHRVEDLINMARRF